MTFCPHHKTCLVLGILRMYVCMYVCDLTSFARALTIPSFTQKVHIPSFGQDGGTNQNISSMSSTSTR